MMPPVHVAAAVICDDQGRILLARRGEDMHQGGLWEFPGGKLEPGESIAQGLKRELKEELGIDLIEHRPLIGNLHHYSDKSVLLDVHLVKDYQGVPRGIEGQPLQWVEPERLSDFSMPAADVPIIAAINLPDRYLITGPDPKNPEQFLAKLKTALDCGLRLVQLRVRDMSESELLDLGSRVLELCRGYGVRMMLNGSPELAQEMGADGVHLNSKFLGQLTQRPLTKSMLVAASCHSAAELTHAAEIGLDFALLSPVKQTSSHPEAVPLGWDRFGQIVTGAKIPVYALGGMQQDDLHRAWEYGAQGIAGISCFWQ
jgi:8-oxo-dGTP diphosphatase